MCNSHPVFMLYNDVAAFLAPTTQKHIYKTKSFMIITFWRAWLRNCVTKMLMDVRGVATSRKNDNGAKKYVFAEWLLRLLSARSMLEF